MNQDHSEPSSALSLRRILRYAAIAVAAVIIAFAIGAVLSTLWPGTFQLIGERLSEF